MNVVGLADVLLNVTALNSGLTSTEPPNVIVPPVAELKVTVPVPASQLADVLEFVHVPETVQLPLPKSMNDVATDMFTVATAPVVVLVAQLTLPPESVNVPEMLMLPPFVLQLNGRLPVLWVWAPTLVHELAPRAMLLLASLNPLSVKLAILAAAFTVNVLAAVLEEASNVTLILDVGAKQPLAPPDTSDHIAGLDQFPTPVPRPSLSVPTQNLDVLLHSTNATRAEAWSEAEVVGLVVSPVEVTIRNSPRVPMLVAAVPLLKVEDVCVNVVKLVDTV